MYIAKLCRLALTFHFQVLRSLPPIQIYFQSNDLQSIYAAASLPVGDR